MRIKHTMQTTTVILLERLSLTEGDATRLILEFTEELGERAKGPGRDRLIQLLRRAMRTGVLTIEQEEKTVTFAEAAHSSIEARKERCETTVRDLRYYVHRILQLEGIGNPLSAQ